MRSSTSHRYLLTMIEAGFLRTPHQLGETHAVRSLKASNRPEGWALYTTFDRAQLCSVYAELDESIELGKPCPLSNFTQHTSESLFRA